MDRFGRPRFRGSGAPKPYGARPGSSSQPRSLLGPSPRHPGGQLGSFQDSDSKSWSNSRSTNSGGSVIRHPSRNPPSRDSSFSRTSNDRSNISVPSDVRQLMESLGLSQSDMQKLSELPESELSVGNLAKAIGNLKQGKKEFGGRVQSASHSQSPRPEPLHSASFSSRSFSRDETRKYPGEGLLGEKPKGAPFHDNRTQRNERSYTNQDNHPPSGIKVTVKPGEPSLGGRSRILESKHDNSFSDRRQFASKNQRDSFHEEQQFYSGRNSTDRFEQTRHDTFSPNNRRVLDSSFNDRENLGEKPVQFGNERRVERRDAPQGRPSQPVHRPVGTRNAKPLASTLPSLLDLPVSPKRRSSPGGFPAGGRESRGPELEKMVAAVNRNSLLSPLMIASHADPSVLEAQIQAMKVIQAEAIKMRSGGRERDRPMRRSPPPPSRAIMIDRKMQEEARKEAHIMRQARGRVLYIKFKSPRITENDLRQLASAFGRVTKLLIIKPKIKNGHFQAFMEMEQWDCAAAMLERYLAKPPSIKGSPVDVQRSNYVDLQLKSDMQRGKKRQRSISPVRKGTTQLKRERRGDGKPTLTVTTSRTDRRVVSEEPVQAQSTQNKDKKVDARDILNSRSKNPRGKTNGAGSRRRSSNRTKSDAKKEEVTTEPEIKEEEKTEIKEENKEIKEKEKVKEEVIDPLDAIADELALHDDFVLMDEVGHYDKDLKKKVVIQSDFDGSEPDLDNVKVEDGDLVEFTDSDFDTSKVLSTSSDKINTEHDEDVHVVGEVLDEVVCQVEVQEKVEAENAFMIVQTSTEENEEEALLRGLTGDNEVHEYVYDNSLNENENTEAQQDEPDKELELSEDIDESIDQEESLEDSTDENEVKKLRTVLSDSLKEIQEAKSHLDAIVKSTKAKAVHAIVKKLRVCLEVAISNMEGNEGIPI